ncbi:MAG: hypothetical protein HQL41_04145 [Alphaproteobacteria bacterium]|nr:hypothetical protein [Alphaproteobacteria bacterium]
MFETLTACAGRLLARVPPDSPLVPLLAQAGVESLGLDLAKLRHAGLGHAAVTRLLRDFAAEARATGFTPYAWDIDRADDLATCLDAGYALLSGPAIGPARPSPGGVSDLPRERLLAG